MNKVERRIGRNCSLAMAGIKTANLISLLHKDFSNLRSELDELTQRLSSVGIVITVVSENSQRVLVMVYRKKLMQNKLAESESQKFLRRYGYEKFDDIEKVLEQLGRRIEENDGFPHEIGVFLGYPLDDIIGFIENPNGSKMSGLWKVYNNVEERAKQFATYKKCTQAIGRRMALGHNLSQIFSRAM